MDEDLQIALEKLRNRGVILYPTDTVWGIGCDATEPEAVERVYSIKARKDKKSMIILIDEEHRLASYVEQVPEVALELIGVSDKPLTIIYPGGRNIASDLIAEDRSIAIRIVRDPFCNALIAKLGKPLVSTSANVSGMPWPENFSNIDPAIIETVDYTVKWRQDDLTKGRPSSIIKVGLHGEVSIIRE